MKMKALRFLSEDSQELFTMMNQGIGSSTLFGMSTATKPDMDFQEGNEDSSRFGQLLATRLN